MLTLTHKINGQKIIITLRIAHLPFFYLPVKVLHHFYDSINPFFFHYKLIILFFVFSDVNQDSLDDVQVPVSDSAEELDKDRQDDTPSASIGN